MQDRGCCVGYRLYKHMRPLHLLTRFGLRYTTWFRGYLSFFLVHCYDPHAVCHILPHFGSPVSPRLCLRFARGLAHCGLPAFALERITACAYTRLHYYPTPFQHGSFTPPCRITGVLRLRTFVRHILVGLRRTVRLPGWLALPHAHTVLTGLYGFGLLASHGSHAALRVLVGYPVYLPRLPTDSLSPFYGRLRALHG